jgi:hypothetical protein
MTYDLPPLIFTYYLNHRPGRIEVSREHGQLALEAAIAECASYHARCMELAQKEYEKTVQDYMVFQRSLAGLWAWDDLQHEIEVGVNDLAGACSEEEWERIRDKYELTFERVFADETVTISLTDAKRLGLACENEG